MAGGDVVVIKGKAKYPPDKNQLTTPIRERFKRSYLLFLWQCVKFKTLSFCGCGEIRILGFTTPETNRDVQILCYKRDESMTVLSVRYKGEVGW